MKKLLIVLGLAGSLALSPCTTQAIEFKVMGLWQTGMGFAQKNFVQKKGDHRADNNDLFNARNRIRSQIDAKVSDNLSGSVHFEIGHMQWGQVSSGGALGTDANIVKVRMAFMDWQVPDTSIKVRMGLQNVYLPNKAGNSSVMGNCEVAGIASSLSFTENVGLTFWWFRPFNDNQTEEGRENYLDNMDLWGVSVPINMDGFSFEPWVMYGIRGKNTFTGQSQWGDGNPMTSMGAYPFGMTATGARGMWDLDTDKAYGSMFWVGLPIGITALDPWNIEFEFNYGYVEGMGRYDAFERGVTPVRGNTERKGWLAKALVEYKADWGTPGILGWYGSGDDGSIANGSERMPSVRPNGMFTSLMGDEIHYGGALQDQKMTYAGTWGLGLQVKDVEFIENITHTLRAVYWGGTNSPSMVRYAGNRTAWNYTDDYEGLYLTTNDGLLEFNLNTIWQAYENLGIGLRLGYIVNMMDSSTWQDGHSYLGENYAKQDIWCADLTFVFSF